MSEKESPWSAAVTLFLSKWVEQKELISQCSMLGGFYAKEIWGKFMVELERAQFVCSMNRNHEERKKDMASLYAMALSFKDLLLNIVSRYNCEIEKRQSQDFVTFNPDLSWFNREEN